MEKKVLKKKDYKIVEENDYVKVHNIVTGSKETLRKEKFQKLYKLEAEKK